MSENVLFWGQVDPLHRASSVPVEEAVDYYRKSFKTLNKSISVEEIGNNSKSLKFSQSAATSLNDVLGILMKATKEQLGTQLAQHIFQPPTKSLPKKYFPKAVAQETPEYFLQKHRRTTRNSKAPTTYFCDRTPMKQPVVIDTKHWNHLQAKESNILQKRGKHLLAILEEQQLLEIEREMKLTRAAKDDDTKRMKCIADIAKERYEAADRIMRILDDYGIVPSSTVIQYFQSTLSINTSIKRQNRTNKYWSFLSPFFHQLTTCQMLLQYLPVVIASSISTVILLQLVCCLSSPLLLTYSAIRGRKYDWYLYAMSFTSHLSVFMCMAMPLVVVFSSTLPCSLGYVLRFILPVLTSYAFLFAHMSVLIVFKSKEPVQEKRWLYFRLGAVLGLIIYCLPLAWTDSSVFSLPIASCSTDSNYQFLNILQMTQISAWICAAIIMTIWYKRSTRKNIVRFRQIYLKTLRYLGFLWLVSGFLAVFAITLPWDDYWDYYIDYVLVVLGHFIMVYCYFDGYRRGKSARRISGPHVRNISNRTMSNRTMSNRTMSRHTSGRSRSRAEDNNVLVSRQDVENLRGFLSREDYFADVVAFAETLQQTKELYAWRLVQLYKIRKVPAAAVYHDCMEPKSKLASAPGIAMASRVEAIVQSSDTSMEAAFDKLYEEFEGDLLITICVNILPKYEGSGRLWNTYIEQKRAQPQCQLVSVERSTDGESTSSSPKRS